jgi:large subunit ribosomal protein L15
MSINQKRNKKSRIRGRRGAGKGFMKKGRGKGHRGGIGMAGTGKRADHKKTLILNLKEKYFGSGKLKAKEKNYEIINIEDLEKKAGGKKELNLENYKILGRGEINVPITIKVKMISKSAKKKIEDAGGKVILSEEENKKSEE